MQGKHIKPLEQIGCRYLVSEDGEIYSLMGPRGLRKKSKKLKQSVDKKGYKRVTLYLDGGVKYATRVHRLVASVFCGLDLFDGNYTIHHIDKNRENNHYSNLEVKTMSDHFSYHAKASRKNDVNSLTPRQRKIITKIRSNQVADFFEALGVIVED